MERKDYTPDAIRADIAATRAERTAADEQKRAASYARRLAAGMAERTAEDEARVEHEDRRTMIASFIGELTSEHVDPQPYQRLNGIDGRGIIEPPEIESEPESRRWFSRRPASAPRQTAEPPRTGWKIRDNSRVEQGFEWTQGGRGEEYMPVEKKIYDYVYVDTDGTAYVQPPIDNQTLYNQLKDYILKEPKER